MPNYIKVIAIGHLTRDPEVKSVGNDNTLAKGGIAVSRKFGGKEEVCFLDWEAWGKQASVMGEHLEKGRAVLLEGRLKMDQWQDKDGNNRTKHLLSVERFEFMGGPRGERDGGGNGDDIPF